MEREEMVRTARRRARMQFGFFIHLTVFIAVNALLYLTKQQASSVYAWPAIPLGGWAIGLTVHGLALYLSGTGLRERMVEAELRKLESRGNRGAH